MGMLIVGTDRMRVLGHAGAPEGARHAVDVKGRVLCRTTRARFAWPALSWDDHRGEETACPLCVQVRTAQEALSPETVSQVPAYPAEPTAQSTTTALVPWQPLTGSFGGMELFESDAS